MPKLTNYEEAFYALDWKKREYWLAEALKICGNDVICPVCKRILTGLHEQSPHFRKYIAKVAAKMWKQA